MTTTHIDDDEIAVWVAGLREAIEREDGIVTETECPGCDDLLRERDDLAARLAAVRALCEVAVRLKGDYTGPFAAQVLAVLAAVNDPAEGWPDEDAARFLNHERQQRAAVDDPAEPCGRLRECPPHRYPDGMPDEVIAWRCAKCGETVRE